jgi:chromate reductase
MITVIGLSGSLRRGSYNAAVLHAAGSLMPSDSELRIESIAGIPLYDGDDEAVHGVPDLVSRHLPG